MLSSAMEKPVRSGLLAGRRSVNCERVYAAGKLIGKGRIDHAMTFETGLPFEGIRHNIDAKVRLSPRPMTGMSAVAVGFVDNVQAFGRKGPPQLVGNRTGGVHRRALAAFQPPRQRAVNDAKQHRDSKKSGFVNLAGTSRNFA